MGADVLDLMALSDFARTLSTWKEAELLAKKEELPPPPDAVAPRRRSHEVPAFLPDNTAIRRMLPREVAQAIQNAGLKGTFGLSFALRHRCAQLSFLLHAGALLDRGLGYPRTWDALYRSYFGNSLEGELRETLPLFEDLAPLGVLPVAGFTALGFHLEWCPAGGCRAFDAYALPKCGEPCEGLFCRTHQEEVWWSAGSQVTHESQGASQQAKAFAWYAQRNHVTAFAEEELQKLLSDFWKKWGQTQWTTKQEVQRSLEIFGYENDALWLQDVQTRGVKGVRQRYLTLARVNHPDAGGTGEGFAQIQRAYEVLLGEAGRVVGGGSSTA